MRDSNRQSVMGTIATTMGHVVSLLCLLSIVASAQVQAQDPSDILIIGNDAGNIGPNPNMIRANSDGEILWQKDIPLLVWGSDQGKYGARNLTEDALYLMTHTDENKVDGKHRLLKFDVDLDSLDPLVPEWDIPLTDTRTYLSANPVDGGVYAMEMAPNGVEVGPGNRLHKFAGDGTLIWTLDVISPHRISTDTTSGGVYVASLAGVLKLAGDGSVIWETVLPNSDPANKVNANPIDGGAYVGYGSYSRNTHRLDTDGNIIWTKTSFPSNWTYGRAVSPLDGGLYIGSGWGHRVAHVAMDGTVLFNNPTVGINPLLTAAIDEIAVYDGEGYGLGVFKYDGYGNVVWHRIYGPADWTPADGPSPWTGELGVYTGMPSAVVAVPANGVGELALLVTVLSILILTLGRTRSRIPG